MFHLFRDIPYAERPQLITYPVKPYTPLRTGKSKPEPVTVLYFSYYQYTNQINYTPLCDLDFDCIVTHDGFPEKNHWSNYSALMAFGKPAFLRLRRLVGNKANHRDPKQMWVARDMESSGNRLAFLGAQNEFNITVGLSPLATVRDSYFAVFKKKKQIEDTSTIEKEYSRLEKDKDFCWMVSACGSSNNRLDVASEIINKLPGKINMWGAAFKRCMPKVNRSKVVDHGSTPGKTEQQQLELSKCKFYFALENSNCSDYITEKFGNALANYAIPIVNGWRESYEEALHGSFIHIADFENSSQLAEYLSRLLANREEFFAYHKWRLKYDFLKEETAEIYNLLHCRVCEKVYKTREANKNSMTEVSTIANLGGVFKSLQKCAPR